MTEPILWFACAIVGGFLGSLIVAYFAGLLKPRAEPPVADEMELKCWYQSEEPTTPAEGHLNMWLAIGNGHLYCYDAASKRWIDLSLKQWISTHWWN